MRLGEVEARVKSYDLSRFPFEMKFRFNPLDANYFSLTLSLKVLERDTREPTTISLSRSDSTRITHDQLDELIMDMLRYMVMHELEESVFVNGVRKADPHTMDERQYERVSS